MKFYWFNFHGKSGHSNHKFGAWVRVSVPGFVTFSIRHARSLNKSDNKFLLLTFISLPVYCSFRAVFSRQFCACVCVFVCVQVHETANFFLCFQITSVFFNFFLFFFFCNQKEIFLLSLPRHIHTCMYVNKSWSCFDFIGRACVYECE